MSPENIARVRQAFPRFFSDVTPVCDDKWFPLIMSFGAKLEALAKDLPADQQHTCGVQSINENEGGLSLQVGPCEENITRLIREFEGVSRNLEKSGTDQHPYHWTHNSVEQTTAEEAVRADKAPHSIEELQRDTVRSAEIDRAG